MAAGEGPELLPIINEFLDSGLRIGRFSTYSTNRGPDQYERLWAASGIRTPFIARFIGGVRGAPGIAAWEATCLDMGWGLPVVDIDDGRSSHLLQR